MAVIKELTRSPFIELTSSKPEIPLFRFNSSQEQIKWHSVTKKILERVNFLIKEAPAMGNLIMESTNIHRNVKLVERNTVRNRLVAALIVDGEKFGAILFGNLPDGTPLEVSFGQTESYGMVPTYRIGEQVGDGAWNIFFPAHDHPYLAAVGVRYDKQAPKENPLNREPIL